SSNIYINDSNGDFDATNGNAIINRGTSTVHLIGQSDVYLDDGQDLYDIIAYGVASVIGRNSDFHNITFLAEGSVSSGSSFVTNTYNKVIFNDEGSATVCNHTFDTLAMLGAPNKTFTFGANKTVTINNKLEVSDGTCALPNTLKSSSVSSQATVHYGQPSFTFNYWNFEDMNFTGASWTGNNVVFEDGNNTGITLNTLGSNNYYWVGNGGNWSDPTHWALSSGGPGQSATGCIPTLNDSVFFDNNSFSVGSQTVTLDIDGTCKNMSWLGATNNPSFSTGSFDLSIYGSMYLISNMSVSGSGLNSDFIFLSATASNSITTNTTHIGKRVTFQGTGTYNLIDSISAYQFDIEQGTINTNNNAINSAFNDFNISGFAACIFNIGSSHIYISHVNGDFTSSNGSATINPGTSTIHLKEGNDISLRDGQDLYDVIAYKVSTVSGLNSDFHNITFYDDGTVRANSSSATNTYNKVIFSESGDVEQCHHTFDTLELLGTPNKTYRFAASRTATVNNKLTANAGTCALPNLIRSTSTSSQATLNYGQASFSFDFFNFEDMNFGGTATWTGNNVVYEDGNNSGISLNVLGSNNYYWVGNTGNWSDPTHWALSSGGAGQSATGCIPTLNDSVFFDNNSFSLNNQVVTLDIDGVCKNMSWLGATNNPQFSTGSFDLSIYGSLYFVANMSISGSGSNSDFFLLSSTANNTITSNTTYIGKRLTFDGTGTYNISDSLSAYQLDLENGILNLNNPINMEYRDFDVSGSNACTLNMGSSKIYISNSNGDLEITNGNSIINEGTSTVYLLNSSGVTVSADGKDLYDVIAYENSTVRGRNSTFHNITFYGEGEISSNSSLSTNIFNKVIFYENGGVSLCNHTIDTLLFLGNGLAYEAKFVAGRVITINDTLGFEANGCFRPSISPYSGTATITMGAGASNIDDDFLNIQNMTITGSGTYNLGSNSSDLGGNTGWTFTGPTYTTTNGKNYYCLYGAPGVWLKSVNHEFASSFIWSTGATIDSINVTSPTIEWVDNNYGVNCIARDSFFIGNGNPAGNVNLNFTQSADSNWQFCSNWENFDIPDQLTDVIIPTGRTAYIGDNVQAYCDNLTIQNGAVLRIGGGKLHIYGDITNNGTIIHSSDSVIIMGDDNATVSGTSTTTFLNLYIEKTDGDDTLKLNTGIGIDNEMKFTTGIVSTTSANYVTFNSASSCDGGNADSYISGPVRKIGSADFVFPTGHLGKWARIGISDLVSSNTFEAEYKRETFGDNSVDVSLNNVSLSEYWNLNKISGSSGAKVTLYWEDNGFSGITSIGSADLVVAHYDGSDWESYGNTAATGMATGSVTSAYYTDFSPFKFGSPSGVNPLPVELVAFDVQLFNDNNALITWTTASESNTDYFTIEKTTDFQETLSIDTVKAQGNSSVFVEYKTKDFDLTQNTCYYRLKMVDKNGEYNHSSWASVTVSNTSNDNITFTVFPNPLQEGPITVHSNAFDNKEVLIVVQDVSGKEYFSKVYMQNHSEEINIAIDPRQKLSPGIYIITGTSDNAIMRQRVVVK
ncbi:MAG: T9SS type A sorting domain-containing protein, partial [Flavobacteriales bacterium]|nr:T9SS type A sorting domain-containing protein [Flavobacteriales bacterium]